jgi:signal transduction histidine kinase
VFATSSAGATTALLFTIAIHRRFAVVAAVMAASILTLPLYFLIVGSSPGGLWFEATIAILLMLVAVGWGMIVRARRQLVMSLRERALRAESEQQLRVEQARHHERERIAREMHDVLAHRISLLSVHAGALEFRPDAPPEEIAAAAGVIRASAHQALQDLREVISVLRGDASGGDIGPARPQPTIVDLPELVEESRLAGMRVELTNRIADLGAVPSSVGRGAYRIVQEGLTNARKHAPDTAVVVRVDGEAGDGIDIELRNRWPDGATSDIPGAGAGLVGLTERVSLAGGRIEHGRTPDGEFRLHAWLPWPA